MATSDLEAAVERLSRLDGKALRGDVALVLSSLEEQRAENAKLRAACKAWVDYFDHLDAVSDPDDPLTSHRRSYHQKRLDACREAMKGGAP
jgi:hypothetical protein